MFKAIKNLFSKKEEVPETTVEQVEVLEDEEVIEYCRDPEIELTNEDVEPIKVLMAENKMINNALGPMRIQYLNQERAYMNKIISNNEQINALLSDLLTTYSVDPEVDYELNFPDEEGGLPVFKKLL